MTLKKTKQFEAVQVGEALPVEIVPITVELVAGGAIATRDYYPGHHDPYAAKAQGAPHIFMNILSTNALVQRYVEQWAGPEARFESIKIKLGAPNCPGDSMTFQGQVSAVDSTKRSVEVSLGGKNAMGYHVTGTVSVVLP